MNAFLRVKDDVHVVRSSSGQRVSETVRQAIMEVCRTAFYYKGDVRAVFLSASLPPIMWDRHDHGETSYKVLIVKNVLADLRDSQKTGARQIERDLVEELCQFAKPHAAATNPAEGRRSLAELKRLAQQEQLLVSPEQVEVEARRKAAAKKDADERTKQEKLAAVRRTFQDLSQDHVRAPGEVQQRGYALEKLIADLFEANNREYRRSYAIPHEQIDGSFKFGNFTYLVEAKWKKQPPGFGALADFKGKVSGKLQSTRGLFVSMAGFDDGPVERLVTQTGQHNIILMDQLDLVAIIEGYMTLEDALTAKVEAAEQRGEWWYPLMR